MEVMKKMEGAYALLIKSRHYPGEMVAAKRGSPMIVGIKEGSQAKNKSGGGLAHRCVACRPGRPRQAPGSRQPAAPTLAAAGRCATCHCPNTLLLQHVCAVCAGLALTLLLLLLGVAPVQECQHHPPA